MDDSTFSCTTSFTAEVWHVGCMCSLSLGVIECHILRFSWYYNFGFFERALLRVRGAQCTWNVVLEDRSAMANNALTYWNECVQEIQLNISTAASMD